MLVGGTNWLRWSSICFCSRLVLYVVFCGRCLVGRASLVMMLMMMWSFLWNVVFFILLYVWFSSYVACLMISQFVAFCRFLLLLLLLLFKGGNSRVIAFVLVEVLAQFFFVLIFNSHFQFPFSLFVSIRSVWCLLFPESRFQGCICLVFLLFSCTILCFQLSNFLVFFLSNEIVLYVGF